MWFPGLKKRVKHITTGGELMQVLLVFIPIIYFYFGWKSLQTGYWTSVLRVTRSLIITRPRYCHNLSVTYYKLYTNNIFHARWQPLLSHDGNSVQKDMTYLSWICMIILKLHVLKKCQPFWFELMGVYFVLAGETSFIY